MRFLLRMACVAVALTFLYLSPLNNINDQLAEPPDEYADEEYSEDDQRSNFMDDPMFEELAAKGRRNPLIILKVAKDIADEHNARDAADREAQRQAMEGDYSDYTVPVEPEDGWTAMEYVGHFVHVYCSPDVGFVVKCNVRNEGEYEISYLEVGIRYSTKTLDTYDGPDAGYEPYRYELEGPFADEGTSTFVKEMPDEKTQWISGQTKIVAARF